MSALENPFSEPALRMPSAHRRVSEPGGPSRLPGGPRPSNLSITELSRRSGLTVRTLRYYEEVGLLEPPRTVGNARVYLGVDIAKLEMIARLRAGGVTLAEILGIYRDGADAPPAALLEVTRASLARVESQKQVLLDLLKMLEAQ